MFKLFLLIAALTPQGSPGQPRLFVTAEAFKTVAECEAKKESTSAKAEENLAKHGFIRDKHYVLLLECQRDGQEV